MKWWLIMDDIYRPAKKEGKYLLFCRTPKEVYRLLVCTIYTGDTTSGQKKIALFETISRHMVEDSTFRYLQYG